MPYILCSPIQSTTPPLWGEGSPYATRPIYTIESAGEGQPPVNYQAHTLKPHSLCHVDAPNHILSGSPGVEDYFSPERQPSLWGQALVVKIQAPDWQRLKGFPALRHCELSLKSLQENIERVTGRLFAPEKLLLSAHPLPLSPQGQHHPDYALTLSLKAAQWLCGNPRFNAFGTSWKSSDFQPGRRERPIHALLLPRAVIYECLDLMSVPEGLYGFVGVPLPLMGASESPVCPVLFTPDEIKHWLAYI